MTTAETIREAIAALEHEAELTSRLVAELSDSDAERVIYDSGWTIKDALGHVASSHTGLLRAMRGDFTGQAPRADLGTRNETFRQERATWPLARVLDELAENRQVAIAHLTSLGEDQLDRVLVSATGVERPVWRWAWVFANHERDHRRDVARALGQRVSDAFVASLNISNGGVPKLPVFRRALSPLGLEGDAHRSPRHGGPSAALCLYSLEVIGELRAEGHPIQPGSVGENITIAGVDWSTVQPGDRLRIGPALIELTRFTTPCTNVAGFFKEGAFDRILQTKNPGDARVYASVVETGVLTVGDPVEVLGVST
jgi:MOSC domain-containing protein YiiM